MMPLAPRRPARAIAAWLCAIGLAAPAWSGASSTYTVLRTLPHATDRYTQGLEFWGDALVESAGRYGRSAVYRWAPDSGRILAERQLPADIFAEGLTRVGEHVLVLSWREGIALVLDEQLQLRGRFTYLGQGWGLCHDGRRLLMSDGSDRLQIRDPASFARLGTLPVTDRGAPVARINELECVGDQVYANRFQTDELIRIDGHSGEVTARWDLSGLRLRFRPGADWNPRDQVLNGIAYHRQRRSFFVTGKNWPVLFELDLHQPEKVAADDPAE